MSSGDLLQIHPMELQFPFELEKKMSCSMQLTNKSDNYVAFKVKTTHPKKYSVRPKAGVVSPHSTCYVVVTMQAQMVAPPDMLCWDKFLIQSTVVDPGVSRKYITEEMFNKEWGNQVDECKLTVAFVSPLHPPSPVQEGSEEGSSPRASISDNGTVNQNSELVRGKMSSGDLLQIDLTMLQFPFELEKQISCSMKLTNKLVDHVAFKVMTTNPKEYTVKPNNGVVLPHSTCGVVVTMQGQMVAPPDMLCWDKFLIQSTVVDPGVSLKYITEEMATL